MESSSLHSVIILVPYSAMILYANYPNVSVAQSRMQYQPYFEVPSYTFHFNIVHTVPCTRALNRFKKQKQKRKKIWNKLNKNKLNRNEQKSLFEITIDQLIILLYRLIFQSGSQPIIKLKFLCKCDASNVRESPELSCHVIIDKSQ